MRFIAGAEKPHFLADAMLLKLARWLRMLGYSAQTPKTRDDDDLIRIASENHLILLTADKALCQRAKNYSKCCLISGNGLESRLLQVCCECRIDPRKIRERDVPSKHICSMCNGTLAKRGKRSLKSKIPHKSFDSVDDYLQCARCKRVFWEGSHNAKILRTLSRLKRIFNTKCPK
ncbi:MAG: Mut7-C RNAse domain-containing protein [Candidatus Micrarchaeota archaeon]